MSDGVSDEVIVAAITVTGVMIGAAVALVGHMFASRMARKNRMWASVWPEKAKAYEALLRWSQNESSMSDVQVWVYAQIYASPEVRKVINQYLRSQPDGDVTRLRSELGPAIRSDLQTNIRLG